ncbi:MAG: MarR family transcriptional regulator [Firmicutes bacterium]|nr:MarR family transcriptional regulator [Bacillota bacterium]
MPEKSGMLPDIAELLPEIMRKLFGGRLVVSKAWELSVPQLRVLSIVAEQPGCTMGALARSLGIGMSAATGIADRLVHQGLLEREGDPEDRRLVLLHLSESGRRAREACRRERRRRVEQALQRLSSHEQAQIAAALVILHRALDGPQPSVHRGGKEKRGE